MAIASGRAVRRGKKERQEQILAELKRQPSVRVSDIASRLGVHVETIRRDLDDLQAEGKISRTYGGALAARMGFEASLAERDALLVEERRKIAERAVALVSSGDVIMADVGSTTAHFASLLAERDLDVRIITNSCRLLAALGGASNIEAIMCPGKYSARQGGVSGPETTAFLSNFHADKVFFSVGGITAAGLYEVDSAFAWVKRTMIANAGSRVLLLDQSKLDRACMTRVCGFEDIDTLVIDGMPEHAIKTALSGADVDILTA